MSVGFMVSLGIFASGLQWFFDEPEDIFTASISDAVAEDMTDIDIDAQAAISVSVKTDFSGREVLFDKNSDRKLPVASISKLITALVILDNYDLSQQVKISPAAQDSGGSEEPLKAGESFFAKDLLYAMLIGSDNAASMAFSDLMGTNQFVGLMNEKAQELGLSDTSFGNPTGLGLDNFSTANDMAKLAEYLLKERPSVFHITTLPEFDLYTADGRAIHKIINTNDLVREDSDFKKRIVGGKTGETRQAGQCLLSVFSFGDGKSFLINVVLNSENRFEEMKKIIKWLGW